MRTRFIVFMIASSILIAYSPRDLMSQSQAQAKAGDQDISAFMTASRTSLETNEKDPGVRINSIQKLGEFLCKDPEDSKTDSETEEDQLYDKHTNDKVEGLRYEMNSRLPRCGDWGILDALVQTVQSDSNLEARAEAVKALENILKVNHSRDFIAVRALVVEYFSRKDQHGKDAAITALYAGKTRDIAAFAVFVDALMKNPDPNIRLRMANALRKDKGHGSVATLAYAAANDPDVSVQDEAKRSLLIIGTPEAQFILRNEGEKALRRHGSEDGSDDDSQRQLKDYFNAIKQLAGSPDLDVDVPDDGPPVPQNPDGR